MWQFSVSWPLQGDPGGGGALTRGGLRCWQDCRNYAAEALGGQREVRCAPGSA